MRDAEPLEAAAAITVVLMGVATVVLAFKHERADADLTTPPDSRAVEERAHAGRATGERMEASELVERERVGVPGANALDPGDGDAASNPPSPTYTGLDPERFAPTVDTCAKWMVTIDRRYPELVRSIWDEDPKFRASWATTQEYRAIQDVLSRYDEDQLERFQTHQPTQSLLDYIGFEGIAALHRLAPDKTTLYDALDNYDAEVQNHLWMAGREVESAPTLDAYWRLLRVIQESDPTSQAAQYLRDRISQEASE